MAISEGRVPANDVDFAFLEEGSGPLALCLHGFPDSAFTYRHLLPELADGGVPRRGPVPPRVRADRRSPPTAATRPAPSVSTPARCTRRSGATTTP